MMALLQRLPPMNPVWENLLDASALSVVILPFLYFLIYRPLLRQVRRNQDVEASLRRSRQQLETQSTFLRTILDSDPNLISVKDWDGKFVLVNRAAADLYGTTPADLLGKSAADFTPGAEGAAQSLKLDRQVMESGGTACVREESVPDAGTGETRWFQTLRVPLLLADGQLRMVLGVATDITERRRLDGAQKTRLEIALRRQAVLLNLSQLDTTDMRETFRTICRVDAEALEAERVSVWLFNEDRSALVCRALYKCKEASYEEGANLKVKDFPRYFHGLERNRFIAADDAGNDPLTAEFKNVYLAPLGITSMMDAPIRRGGELIGVVCHEHVGPARIWTMEEKEFAGAVGDFVSLALETAERRRAEIKSREQAALLDLTRDAVLVMGLDDRILHWNRGAEGIYGWKAEEAVGKDAARMLSAAGSAPDVQTALRRTLERGEWSGTLSRVAKDGRAILAESRWTLMRNEIGEPKSIMAVDTDVTEKRRIEEVNLRNQRIESIGTLAGGIAHDLNNVLAPILMAMPIFRRLVTDPDGMELLRLIENSTKRGVGMVRQILTFSRGVKGERTYLPLGGVMKEMQKMAQDTFPKSVQVSASFPPDLWGVMGDGTQLHQVLLNLCVNARDAMPQGGSIAMTAENMTLNAAQADFPPDAKPGPYVRLRVADTGAGIPPDILPRIFDPFFTTKEPGKGTGIGLSTVIGIVKSHGGFIKVASEPGKGTEFAVYLPAETSGAAEADAETDKVPGGDGQTILVVDDESSIREIARATLQTYGYRAITANDGSEAVALYAQNPSINAVLLDMNMPVMDGSQAVKALEKINPGVRIIASSGLETYMDSLGKEDHHIKAFLQKPYIPEKLLRTLHEVVTAA